MTVPLKSLRIRTAILLLCISTITSAAADTLTLKDGRKITGDVVLIGGRYLVKTPAGSQTFAADDIASWDKAAAVPTPTPAGPGPTGRPKDLKAVDPAQVNAKAARLVEQGNAALLGGDAQAALESFRDARDLWFRYSIRVDPNQPAMFAALNGTGIAYMALGRYEKVNDPLDRAYPSSLRDRSLTLNRAILDLVQRVNVSRSVRDLKEFIARQPAPDEVALNVLGACLGLISNDERASQAPFIQMVAQLYDEKNKALESTHPGEGRWGGEWLSTAQARARAAEQSAGYGKYKAAVESVRSAEVALRSAQATRDGASNQAAVAAANAQLARAKENLGAATAAQKEAWKNIPRPEWPKTFPPVLPDSLGGGVFGMPSGPGPAPAVVAIAPAPVTPRAPRSKPQPNPTPDATATPTPTPTDVAPPTPPTPPTPTPAAPPPIVKAGKPTVSRYAVAVPVGPDLLLTAAAPLENATAFRLETSSANVFDAELVRKDAAVGLALLRVKAQRLPYLNLAATFAGGDVICWGFPDVNVFNPAPDSILARTVAPKSDKWTVAMARHPRLAGAAILDKAGNLVGIALGDRDTVASQLPAVPLDQIRAFLGSDAPNAACSNPDPSLVMQLTASREAQ